MAFSQNPAEYDIKGKERADVINNSGDSIMKTEDRTGPERAQCYGCTPFLDWTALREPPGTF